MHRCRHRQLERGGDLDDEPDEQREGGADQQNSRREGKHQEQREPSHQPQSPRSSRDTRERTPTPALSVVRIRGACREPVRVPLLTTPDAEPITTGLQRARRHRCIHRVTQRAYTRGTGGRGCASLRCVGERRSHVSMLVRRAACRCTRLHTSADRRIIVCPPVGGPRRDMVCGPGANVAIEVEEATPV